MKIKEVGITILVIGIVMVIYTSFNYITTEKVVDLGSIQISREENHPVAWHPIVGIIVIVIGGFLVVKSNNSKE